MSRLSLTILASALLLSGCDSGANGGAQQQGELAGAKQSLIGEIDRSYAGDVMPQLTFNDAQGETLDLAALDGKPVLINLWATWCVPCRTEMPLLDNLAGTLGDELQVIVISQDIRGADVVTPYFEEQGFVNLHPWLDSETKLGAALETGGVMPLTILYDADGREIFRVAGDYHWDSEEALAHISEAISE
ncbi:MAG: TlpA disulfide reductase family protein [Erythrobacter sp.]